MAVFFCQMTEYDDPQDWSEIVSFGPQSAAVKYADHCDARSGGELFAKPTSVQIVIVRDKVSGKESRFEIEVEFVKDFHAKTLVAETQ
jgi:hypothetical protein